MAAPYPQQQLKMKLLQRLILVTVLVLTVVASQLTDQQLLLLHLVQAQKLPHAWRWLQPEHLAEGHQKMMQQRVLAELGSLKLC